MAEKIDEAFVEIKPDVDDFARDTRRELNRAFEDVEDRLNDVVDSLDRNFDELTKRLDILFEDLAFEIKQSLDDVSDRADITGRLIGSHIGDGADDASRSVTEMTDQVTRDLRRVDRDVNRTGRNMRNALGGGAAGGALISGLSDIGAVLRNLAAIPLSLGGGLMSILKIAAIAALGPILIGLTGVLLDLAPAILAVPSAVGVLIAAIAPLPIAFMGIGDAIKALVEGDLEKLNEALKNLSPSARNFVMEIRGILKPLRDLRRSVQEAFFSQFRGTLTVIGQRLLPVLSVGLSTVAAALGRVVKLLGEMLTSGDMLGVFRSLFDATARFVDIVGPAFITLIGTFFGQMQHGLPFIERFAFWLARVIERFATWSAQAIQSGRFVGWIETAVDTLRDLGELAGAVFRLIGALAGQAGDEGRGFLDSLTDTLDRLTAFLQSAEGQEFLQDLLNTLKSIGAFMIILVDAFGFVASAVNDFFDGIARLVIVTKLLWQWLKNLGSATGETAAAFGAWISGTWQRIVTFFTSDIPNAIGIALNFVTSLPERLRALVVTAFDAMFFAIGFGIGTMIRNLMELPARIGAIFSLLWNTAVSRTSDGVSRIGTFFSLLPGIIANFMTTAWNIAVHLFTTGRDRLIGIAVSLPDRVGHIFGTIASRIRSATIGAVHAAADIGRNIIQGMINGIESMIGRLIDAAKRAASRAIDGAKRALGIASPSREWFKLGEQSVTGYVRGVDRTSAVSAADIAGAITAPVQAAQSMTTNTHTEVGAREIIVVLTLDGEVITRKIVNVMHANPQEVATAAEVGSTRLSRRR